MDTSHPAGRPATSPGTDVRTGTTDRRTAGRAALVAAGAFLVQPLSVGLLPFDLAAIDDPVELSTYWWAGTLQATEFAVIGVAVLVLVTALGRTWEQSTTASVTRGLGTVAAVGFLLQASLSIAMYSRWLMADLPDFVAAGPGRGAVYFTSIVAGYVFLGTACLGTAGWLVGLLMLERRNGRFGRPSTMFLVIVATLLAAGTLTGFTIPTVILHLPMWVVLGVLLLRRNAVRRAAATP